MLLRIPPRQPWSSMIWELHGLSSSPFFSMSKIRFLNSSVSFHDINMFKPRLRLGHLSTIRTTPIRRFATEARLTSDHVRIVEVGPRDGLQNEKKSISLETKLELISKLARTGVTTIEAGSFVPAKWVPQVCPPVPSAPNRDGWRHSANVCPMLIRTGF